MSGGDERCPVCGCALEYWEEVRSAYDDSPARMGCRTCGYENKCSDLSPVWIEEEGRYRCKRCGRYIEVVGLTTKWKHRGEPCGKTPR